MRDYTSFGSFTPLYIEKKRLLRSLMSLKDWRIAYFTLDELAHHADGRGICYPGLTRLARLVGYAPASVERAIGILHNHDYVKSHVYTNPLTRSTDRVWQVSPYVLWIDEDNIDEALRLWNDANVKKNLMLVEEPTESNQPHKPTSITNQKPATQQQQSERPATSSPDTQDGEGVDSIAEQNRDSRDDVDQIAKRLVQLGTTEAAARAILQTYNSREIRGGINYITKQVASGAAISNPVGLLRHMLARGEFEGATGNEDGYFSGKYAAFIDS